MRVGIDARTLERREDLRGVGVVVSHIVQHLLSEDVELILFYSQPPEGKMQVGGAKQVILRLRPYAVSTWATAESRRQSSLASKVQPILKIIWEQLLLPPAITRERLDLYYAPANRGVPLCGNGPFIGHIHDVIPLVTPYFFDSRPDPPLLTWLFRLVYKTSLAVVAWKARRIITDSECSRRDIERLFPWAKGKVVVIPPGADPRYRRMTDAREIQHAITRYDLPHRFLLYVGGLGQRKNISGLLRAYRLLTRRLLDVPALVVVGKHNAFYDPLQRLATALGIADQVHFPGFVPTEDLAALLSAADLLVYPSFYEGFGLPVLEAMACGCPVVCSETSSLPEVGGDAVLYSNPVHAEDLAEQMERVLTDRALRVDLIERGLRRAREFSMERMTAEVFRVYKEALGRTPVTSARS